MEEHIDIQVETKRSPDELTTNQPECGHGEHEKSDAGGCTTRDMYQEEAQKLIAGINEKRKRDTDVIADYKKSMEMQIEKNCSMMEQNLFQNYETKGKALQEKVQDLYETLDRITKLEDELLEFRQALGMLYQDVHSN